MALSYLETGIRIYQGEISRLEEEPRMAAGSLRPGEPLLAPQTAGPAGGVVSLKSGNRAPESTNEAATRTFSCSIAA
jgi:hypothetical protein